MAVLLMMLLLTFSFIVHITVMIFGWGIQPQNWLVIVGGYIFTLVIMSGVEITKRLGK